MRFRFIEDRRADYPVRILCDVLGVSPAGYYTWRARPESQRAAANRELVVDIKRVRRDTSGRYGSPRIHAELRALGREVSRGRIERLMRRHGIRAIMARPRRVRTTDSGHDFPIAPNMLDRNFTTAGPTDQRAIVPWSLDNLERRRGSPHCAGAHEKSCMEGDQADARLFALPDPARAKWRSPPVRQTKGSALMEVLTTPRNVLVARRPPSGTSVLRQPATPWRLPQHPRSSAPRQSRSRTVYNSLAAPLKGGLAISTLLAHTDPNACISSSQPLLLEC